MKQFLFILILLITGELQAQKMPPKVAMGLQPYRLRGGHFLHKNIEFADYETKRFRRTLGSFLVAPSIQPINLLRISGIPLYHKKKRNSKDVFHFDVYKENTLVSTVTCRADLYTNETFRLFAIFQDSSFFGNRNMDVLEAQIQLTDQPNQQWKVLATNLNGTKREAQKGIIHKDSTAIYFTRTFAVLREKPAQKDNIQNMQSNLYNVYAFTYQNEVVATVTADEGGRRKKVWFKDALPAQLQTVIANTAMILTARRTIYK